MLEVIVAKKAMEVLGILRTKCSKERPGLSVVSSSVVYVACVFSYIICMQDLPHTKRSNQCVCAWGKS